MKKDKKTVQNLLLKKIIWLKKSNMQLKKILIGKK